MSQAKVMAIALNRRMRELKEQIADKGLDEKIAAYLDIVRRYENSREGLAPALTNCSRQAILDLCGAGLLIRLPEKVLTPEEGARCYARRNDITKAAFNKWFARRRHDDA